MRRDKRMPWERVRYKRLLGIFKVPITKKYRLRCRECGRRFIGEFPPAYKPAYPVCSRDSCQKGH